MKRARTKFDLSGIDKREATFTIRIPTKLKYLLDQLDSEHKAILSDVITVAMASVVHDATFDPTIYLKS